ncbi:hypothetical protein TNCV_3004741 [Trichonephila clavipes]|nr:hypothetical protein TNCV_3004741 [Trichonephila clavipes]
MEVTVYDSSRPGGSLAHAGHACSHPRVPRAHQAGLGRRSLAGVGLSENVRCHGPGLAMLTNGGVQQQQEQHGSDESCSKHDTDG